MKSKKNPETLFHLDPFQQFRIWFAEAEKNKLTEPSAMALATVDSKGYPSLRMVLLKGFDEKGLVFFSHYNSRKGVQLSSNPQAAVTFYWKELERQVRIEGKVRKIPARESDAYFNSRPFESRINSCISPQSCIIPDRVFLEVLKKSFIADLNGQLPARPDTWGGYRLYPKMFEFWQGKAFRLHDRILYSKKNNTWNNVRLAP